jgi:hypothetical protein
MQKNITMYYGKIEDSSKIEPVPQIDITTQFNYSNDTVIGYTYIVNLNGYAMPSGNGSSGSHGFGAVSNSIAKIRNTLAKNGSILSIKFGEANSERTILKAKGGILRSFDVNESNSAWVSYANYSASLEFHSVEFIGGSGSWQSDFDEESWSTSESKIFLDDSTYPNSNNIDIVNIKNFKIKSFEDKWSISFNDKDSYNKITTQDNDVIIGIDNTSYNIEYNINAVGKHFHTYTNEDDSSSNKLIPAWEQAKNFVQHRLYHQVTNLINQVLHNNTTTNICNPTKDLTNAYLPGNNPGLLSNVGDSDFMVFNETISCSTSESDGSFSAKYSAIIKEKTDGPYSLPEAKHTITKNVSFNKENGVPSKTISINGNIQGLVEGGLIRHPGPLYLPQQGSFLVTNNNSNPTLTPNRHSNAKKLLDKIFSTNDYNQNRGTTGKRDLKPAFKTVLGISVEELTIPTWSNNVINLNNDPRPDAPHPVSFNLSHNYIDGSINYSLEYNSSNLIGGKKFQEISIQVANPTKIIATFSIPKNNGCAVIQELGTYTAKTINIDIKGIDFSSNGTYNIIDAQSWLNQVSCMVCNEAETLPIVLPSIVTNMILTNKQYTKNPITGVYNINLAYISGTICDI